MGFSFSADYDLFAVRLGVLGVSLGVFSAGYFGLMGDAWFLWFSVGFGVVWNFCIWGGFGFTCGCSGWVIELGEFLVGWVFKIVLGGFGVYLRCCGLLLGFRILMVVVFGGWLRV